MVKMSLHSLMLVAVSAREDADAMLQASKLVSFDGPTLAQTASVALDEDWQEEDAENAEATQRMLLTSRQTKHLQRTLLPNKWANKGGRCMDGTMAGYYYQAPPSDTGSWVIHMDGGGGCSDKTACEKWAKKGSKNGQGGAGSSTTWPAKRDPSINKALGILVDDPDVNPDFHDAHHVQIPYCTADLHTGQVTTPTGQKPELDGWYFSGHLNLELILKHMGATYKSQLKNANRILFTGNSAGGIGNIVNCDFLKDKFASLAESAEVKCAPHSGWFVPGFTEDQTDSELPPSTWENWKANKTGGVESSFQLWQSYAHPDCLNARSSTEASACGSASVVYPYIKTPMYVIQDSFDYAQIYGSLGLPKPWDQQGTQGKEYTAYFGRAMRESTNLILQKSGDGLFLTSCVAHGEGTGIGTIAQGLGDRSTKLKGFTSAQGLGDWYNGRSGPGRAPAILVDDCGELPCNPTCPACADCGEVGR